MTKVRTHEVRGKNGTHVRQQHQRKGGASQKPKRGPRPRRAWNNAKRSHKALKGNRKVTATVFAGAAVAEILAFVLARGVGGFLSVVGIALFGIGAYLWKQG